MFRTLVLTILLCATAVAANAREPQLTLPCYFNWQTRPPVASFTNVRALNAIAKRIAPDKRHRFWRTIHADPLVYRWWAQRLIEKANSPKASEKTDDLTKLLGVPFEAVIAVSTTNFRIIDAEFTTYQFTLDPSRRNAANKIAAKLEARGFSRSELDGQQIYAKGKEGEVDFSFDRLDPFHFEIGKPQRFAVLGKTLLLTQSQRAMSTLLHCLKGPEPSRFTMLPAARALRDHVAKFLKKNQATALQWTAWSQHIRAPDLRPITKKLLDGAFKTGTDMEEAIKKIRKQFAKPQKPPMLSSLVGPHFIDAVRYKNPQRSLKAAERWTLMAVLYDTFEQASAAAPVIKQRMTTFYAHKFKRKAPQFDHVIAPVGIARMQALIFRARAPLGETEKTWDNNAHRLWMQALIFGDLDALRSR